MYRIASSLCGLLIVLVSTSVLYALKDEPILTDISSVSFFTGYKAFITEENGELDEDFSDSIFYHDPDMDPANALRWNGLADYYCGVKYTAPTDFQLQAVRIGIRDGEPDTVGAWVYSDDNNMPDELIAQIWVLAPTIIENNWMELNLDEEDYLEFETNDNFWIIVGPVAGNFVDGWSMTLDDSGPAPRSKQSRTLGDPSNMTEQMPYDWLMTACGTIIGDYVDIVAYSLYNDIQMFHFLADEEVTFSAKFYNRGTIESEEGTVTFIVIDEDGDEVFNNEADAEAIGANYTDTLTVEAGETWTPDESGRYIANSIIEIDDENATDNNEYFLLQQVMEVGDQLSYDDDSFEIPRGNDTGGGWAVAFKPPSYPARLSSISINFNAAQQTSDLRVWTIDDEGEIIEVWTYDDSVAIDWGEFDVFTDENENGIDIEEGMFICGHIAIDANYAWEIDQDPPIAAINPDMPTVGYIYEENEDPSLYPGTIGNFGLRVVYGNLPPFSFNLASPVDEYISSSLEVDLNWEIPEDADGDDIVYDVYVSLDENDLGDPVTIGEEDSTYTFTGEDNNTYYWTVHADDGETEGTMADEIWSFSIFVDDQPDSFGIISPEDNFVSHDTTSLTFEWEQAVDPEEDDVFFTLEIAENDTLDNAMEYDAAMNTTIEVTDLSDDIQYWWRVRAEDPAGNIRFSNEVWWFRTEHPQPPSGFSLQTPEDGATIPFADPYLVTVSWEESIDPDPRAGVTYNVYFDVPVDGDIETYIEENVDGQEVTVDLLAALEIPLDPPWEESKTVQWHVVAVSGDDELESNETWSFILEANPDYVEESYSGIPLEFGIAATYPNPFNPSVTSIIGLPQSADLIISVYNVLGKQVAQLADGRFDAGYHKYTFNAEGMSSGIYFIHAISQGNMNELRKVILVR
ncbi:MAG: T9SS type A sorting domain-containing protein [Candidatus Electryonea clarkiae]|nr:T9SS type A sorting domain-containing protein [Candidatus Electryonea clarkiae]MDP8287718.1 T9SS type A sorting domain-containing protein [Candidatus Electryonea clarkiae]